MLHAQKHEGTWNHTKHMTIVLYTKSTLIQVNWTGLFICPTRDFKASKDYFYNGSNELCRLWAVPLQNRWYVSIAFTHHRPTVYSSKFCMRGPPALECATLKWVLGQDYPLISCAVLSTRKLSDALDQPSSSTIIVQETAFYWTLSFVCLSASFSNSIFSLLIASSPINGHARHTTYPPLLTYLCLTTVTRQSELSYTSSLLTTQ